MLRSIPSLLLLFGLVPAVNGQSVGLLFGGSYSDLSAAGESFGSGYGLSAGAFLPFYVNDRFVVRAEAGFTVLQTHEPELGDTASRGTLTLMRAAVLGRYYAHRNLCFSLGAGWSGAIGDPPPVAYDHRSGVPASSDVELYGGVAYRLSKSTELGLRVGRGLMPAMDMGPYGVAHRRHASLLLSYLLKSAKPTVLKRRNWHSDLGSAPRY